MGYDLYFRARNVTPSFAEMRKWFEGRDVWVTNEDRASYENEATGVYFGFDFTGPDEGRDRLPVAFNINYFRPHVFGLEAEPELRAFVEQFELDVSDPQADGMGDGPYSSAGFLRGWNAGNAFSHRAALGQMKPTDLHVMPSAQIEAAWRWQYQRLHFLKWMETTTFACFVPSMFLLTSDDAPGRVVRAVSWTGDMTVVIPEVDFVLLQTSTSGPHGLWMNELLPHLGAAERWPRTMKFSSHGVDYALGNDALAIVSEPTPALTERVRALAKPFQATKRLSIDQVLCAELVASN